MRVLEPIGIDLGALDLRRPLGYGTARAIPGEIQERVDRALAKARSFIEARGIYAIFPKGRIPPGVPLPHACMAGIAVCTIGGALEEESSRLFAQGEMLEGFLLDTIGSEAVEAAAESLDRRIAADPEAESLFPGRRVSPGYGAFDLRAQAEIFSALPASRIGVSLTDSMMMVPRKSISFALPFGPRPDPGRGEGPCSECPLTTCAYRKEKP